MFQSRRLMLVVVSVLITIPVLYKSRSSSRNTAAQAAFLHASSARAFVQVVGDVRHPGVYPLAANMMTITAIDLAQPAKPAGQYLQQDLLRKPLKNGDSISISLNSNGLFEVTMTKIPSSQRMIMGIPLEISTMTADDFDRLPGVGPVLAKRIVTYRQFNGGRMAVQELLQVEGIGEKKYKQLVKYFN